MSSRPPHPTSEAEQAPEVEEERSSSSSPSSPSSPSLPPPPAAGADPAQRPQREQQRYRARPRARMFETRSQAWRDAGLIRQISPRVVRRARVEALLLVPVFVGIVVVYEDRKTLLKGLHGFKVPVQIAAVFVLMALSWLIARALGKAFGPALFRRLDPPTAGTIGFLLRLITLIACFVVALKVAEVKAQTLEVGGAVSAVVLGLAAQQTLGNVIAGVVLLSAAPFRVGDRVRLQGGSLGGPVEGVVSSLGLFYTTLDRDEGSTMLPNSIMLNALLISDEKLDGVL